jgi:hypothetical protein
MVNLTTDFERRVLKSQYPGKKWQSLVDRLPDQRINELYKKYISELMDLKTKLEKEFS